MTNGRLWASENEDRRWRYAVVDNGGSKRGYEEDNEGGTTLNWTEDNQTRV
jgi:hypothetical protein